MTQTIVALEITPGVSPTIRIGNSSVKRADAASRATLEHAENAVIDAQQRAEDLRVSIAARQERVEHLRRHRNQLATRLDRVQKRDLAAWLTACEDIVDRLYESHELTDPARAVELNSASNALGFIPRLQERAAKIAERLKLELVEANKAVADLESEK